MSKDEKRYTVILSATEGNLRAEGFNRWLKNNTMKAVIPAAVVIVLFFINAVLNNISTRVIASVGVVVIAIFYFRTMSRTGKEFFNKVKDLPEPIDLRKVK